ncbi:MAG: ATP-binding protein, partial [Methanobacterium sp.]
EIIKYPHYSVKGEINEDGYFRVKLRVYASGLVKDLSGLFLWGENKNETDMDFLMLSDEQATNLVKGMSKDEFSSRKIQTGPFEVELRIWDRDELGNIIQKTDSTIQDVRRDLDAVAGINIYRDGFRVLPYGEPDDDWLRLDIRRVQKPSVHLSNNQVVGYISITSDKNPKLKDQSNREGLDENQSLEDLRKILILLLNQIEIIRRPLRKRNAQKTTSKTTQGLFNALNLQSLSNQFATKYPEDKETQQLLTETQQSLDKQVDEIQIVIARYQRLATLGTLIDVVLHDGRHPLGAIVKQAILGQEDVNDYETTKDKPLSTIRQRFEKIEEQGNILDATFDRIEPFSGRKRGKPAQLYLEQVIKNAFDVYHSEIKKMGVEISLPQSENLVRIDQAEIQQIILNLLQNSLYWLEYIEKSKRKIIVTVTRIAEDQIEIIFADSGPGVPSEYKDLIFEPYFSTKPNGAGLGLAIAGEIISDMYNGTLELLNSDMSTGAVFRIILNKRRG